MSKRDQFIAKIKLQLDEVKLELHNLEAKAEHVQADFKDKFRHAIDELHKKRVAAETKLEEIKDAGEETWEGLKDEAERSWKVLKAAMDAIREFSEHS